MPLWLDTSGNTVIAVAICDRCKFKMAIVDAVPDPNSPGVYAHKDCIDNYDPWRLPPRETESITVDHPRPDTPIGTTVLLPGDPLWPFMDGSVAGYIVLSITTEAPFFPISPEGGLSPFVTQPILLPLP